jgi:hypothetical protein
MIVEATAPGRAGRAPRYKPKVAKTLRWRPQGPGMQFLRERVTADFFAGAFDGGASPFGLGPPRAQPVVADLRQAAAWAAACA